MTNTPSPIPPVEPLSESAVAEIEARHQAASPSYCVDWEKGDHARLQASGWRSANEEQPRTIATFDRDDGYLDLLFCAEAHNDIPALCQSLRAARADSERLTNLLEVTTKAHDQRVSEIRQANERNAALREQLACRTIELEREGREMQKWNNRANQLAVEKQELQSRLAQVEKERDEARQKLMRRCSHPNTYPLKEINKTLPRLRSGDTVMTTMNAEERERVRLIQERYKSALSDDNLAEVVDPYRQGFAVAQSAAKRDIDFLLSLRDSQTEAFDRGYLGGSLQGHADGYELGYHDAATRMRDKCVATGKQVVFAEAVRLGISAERAVALAAKVEKALESLTLDSTEQKEEADG